MAVAVPRGHVEPGALKFQKIYRHKLMGYGLIKQLRLGQRFPESGSKVADRTKKQ